MNDFNPIQLKPDTHLVAEAQKEYKRLGSIKIKRGHSLFAFNMTKVHLRKVDLKREAILDINGNVITRSKVFQEPDTIFMPALNAKNALKKILKSFIKTQNQTS